MKAYKEGIVAVAILLVVTGTGFGIAQAGGTQSERPVISFEDMEAPDSFAETRPVLSFEDQEFPQVAKSPKEDMQIENPVESGSLSPESNADFSWNEIGGIPYRTGVDTGP